MRRLSSSPTRTTASYTLKVQGRRLAGSPGAGRLMVQLPAALARLLGWRVGQRLKLQVLERGWRLSVRRVPSALYAVPPRQRTAADRASFIRRWHAVSQAARCGPRPRPHEFRSRLGRSAMSPGISRRFAGLE